MFFIVALSKTLELLLRLSNFQSSVHQSCWLWDRNRDIFIQLKSPKLSLPLKKAFTKWISHDYTGSRCEQQFAQNLS